MASRPALRKAILKNELSMPGLVDVVANFFGAWKIVVSYLKQTGRKNDGDSLVVRSSFVSMLFASFRLLLEICKYHQQSLSMIHVGT